MIARPSIVGVVLAGGLARRMGGGDKGLRLIGGRPMLDRVIERARPQVDTLILNANGDPGRLTAYGVPVVPDVIAGFAGPLAGILTGMEWAAVHRPGCAWLASFATDAPFLPRGLVDRLLSAADDADLVSVESGGQSHPVFGLWRIGLAADLRRGLVDEGIRKIDAWTARHRLAMVSYATLPYDPFFNANAPGDLADADRLAATIDNEG
ncbi:MAG: molybdenum cofactor guanylyltransferase MobA [Alphaproteobacteria bacterium]|nr:molybdenum cofactor guanylyltransferase MobA [Alphaproteobacteria bacterium]